MTKNVLGVVTGAGFCWVSTAVQSWRFFTNSLPPDKRIARAFFSGGIQEVVKKSSVNITQKLTAVSYPTNIMGVGGQGLLTAQAFQNNLMNAFDNCVGQVVRQFNEVIDDIRINGKTQFLKNPKKYAYNIHDATLSDAEIFRRIDGAFAVARQLAADITAELIATSFYFRERPNSTIYNEKKIGGITTGFNQFMAKRFERVMWAGWLPQALESKERAEFPDGPQPPANKPWLDKYYSRAELQKTSPGYYRHMGSGRTIEVYKAYTDPEKAVVKRLTQLGVFLSARATGGHHKFCNKIKGLGMVISDSDVKRLLAWAQREPAAHIEGQTGYGIVRRPSHELYVGDLTPKSTPATI